MVDLFSMQPSLEEYLEFEKDFAFVFTNELIPTWDSNFSWIIDGQLNERTLLISGTILETVRFIEHLLDHGFVFEVQFR